MAESNTNFTNENCVVNIHIPSTGGQKCAKCNIWKPYSDYHKIRSNYYGYIRHVEMKVINIIPRPTNNKNEPDVGYIETPIKKKGKLIKKFTNSGRLTRSGKMESRRRI